MVQTEAQYRFVYLAVKHYIETTTERRKANQRYLEIGRNYTNLYGNTSSLFASRRMTLSNLPAVQPGPACHNRSSWTTFSPNSPEDLIKFFDYENLSVTQPPQFLPPVPPRHYKKPYRSEQWFEDQIKHVDNSILCQTNIILIIIKQWRLYLR